MWIVLFMMNVFSEIVPREK